MNILNFLKNTVFLAFISLLILIFFEIVFSAFYPNFVGPVIINGQLLKNIDWIVIPKTIECSQLGYDIYKNNICDPLNRNHSYGLISLFLPFFNLLKHFYINFFPFILKFLFIFSIIFIFPYKKNKEYLIILIFFLSAPFLLIYERSNTDILIFILIFSILYIKNLFINFFVILYLSLYKFFPFAAVINLFFFNKFKIFFILSLIIFSSLFLSEFSQLNYFLNSNTYNIHPYSIFSFFGLPELFMSFLNNNTLVNFLCIKIFNHYNINIDFQIFKLSFLKTISYLFYIIFITFLLLINFKKIKFILKNNTSDNYKLNYFLQNSFLISSSIIIFCYFLFPSFYYREVFIILLFPYLISLSVNGCTFSNFFANFIMVKIINTSLTIFLVNYSDSIIIAGIASSIRHFVDLIFIIFLSITIIKFFKNSFIQKKVNI